MSEEKKSVELKEEECKQVNGGAGRYDVVYQGEAWSNGGELYVAKQECWFSMIRYVPCKCYRWDNNQWKYDRDIDMHPNNLFDMEYKGYCEL